MVHAKNYETVSTFVEVMQRKLWPLFHGRGVCYKGHMHISRCRQNDAVLSEKLPILAAPLRLVASYVVNHRKIRTNLFCSESTVHWPHFVPDS